MGTVSFSQLMAAKKQLAEFDAAGPQALKANTNIQCVSILLVDQDDKGYIPYLEKFLPQGAKLHIISLNNSQKAGITLSEIAQAAKKIHDLLPDRQINLITTNNHVLRKLIELNAIWVDDTKANPVSTHSWKGATFSTQWNDKLNMGAIETVLIVPPLKQLLTVPEARFLYKRWLHKLYSPNAYLPSLPFTWSVLDNHRDAKAFYDKVKQEAVLISIDIETWPQGHVISCCGYSALLKSGRVLTGVFPVAMRKDWMIEALDYIRALNVLPQPKILQNGRYDSLYFLRWDCPMVNWRYDTYGMNHALFSELDRDLGNLGSQWLINHKYWKDEKESTDAQQYMEYNAKDCHKTLQIFLNQMHFIAQNKDQFGYAIDNYSSQFRLVFPSLQCEAEGIAVDLQKRREVYRKYKAEQEALLAELQGMIGKPFNPGSPKQVKQLFNVILAGALADKHGTDAKGLDMISFYNPLAAVFIDLIKQYRDATKLLGTYLDIAGEDSDKPSKLLHGRVHSSFDPFGTDSSRFAARESSFWCGLQMQNMPRESDRVKAFLMADEGYELCEPDMSQSEARGTSHLSNCAKMIHACEQTPDFHSWQASMFFGIPFEELWDIVKNKSKNKGLRDLSKRVNHGSNYNMGAMVMLTTMGIRKVLEAQRLLNLPMSWKPVHVTQYLVDVFAQTYPEVKKDWYDDIKKEIRLHHTLTLPPIYPGLRGWTRYCFDDPSRSKPALNKYVAHKPQALSVQTIDGAFYMLWAKYQSMEFRLKAQIHDSVFVQIKSECKDKYVPILKETMEVPILMDAKTGRKLLVPVDVPTKNEDGTWNGFGKYWGDLK